MNQLVRSHIRSPDLFPGLDGGSQVWFSGLGGRHLLTNIGYVLAWETQSKLASLALIGLVAFTSIWAALFVMLLWSLVATRTYYHVRERGFPDLLESAQPKVGTSPSKTAWMVGSSMSFLKAWLAGLQPFIYSRTLCRVLDRPAHCWGTRLAHTAVLGMGLTLFGVTTSHHVLRKAGYATPLALRLSFLGCFLNVTYRILVSAVVLKTVFSLLNPPLV